MTNSYYTSAAIELAEKAEVKLFDRAGLATMISRARGLNDESQAIPSAKEVKNEYKSEVNTIECPECSNPMVLRKGKHGVFYGCTSFPKCTGTTEAKLSYRKG